MFIFVEVVGIKTTNHERKNLLIKYYNKHTTLQKTKELLSIYIRRLHYVSL